MDDDREEGGRGVFGVHPLDIVVHPDFQIDHIFELPGESGIQFIETAEGGRLAGGDGDHFPGKRIDAVIEGDLKNFRHIEVAGEDIGLLAEGTGLDAAAGSAFAGVLHGFADPHLFHDHCIGIEYRWVAVTLADHPGRRLEEAVRGLAADMDAGLGLEEVQFVRDFQAEIGDLVAGIGPGRIQAPEVDLGKIVVGPAFLGGDADLGGSGMVVDLDPQAAEQFLGPVAVKTSRGDILFIKWQEMLVYMAGGHGIPAVQFGDGAEMDEPVHLQCFVEGPRLLGRHPPADFGDVFEFGPSLRIFFGVRHGRSQPGMAGGKKNR
ncbi:MAG: hypothetical protein ACD_75C00615G0001 [uncultured bacterium]|nr:MAG: hypothetical protein ACD_75C00615G0001 [uncultured bacterium]